MSGPRKRPSRFGRPRQGRPPRPSARCASWQTSSPPPKRGSPPRRPSTSEGRWAHWGGQWAPLRGTRYEYGPHRPATLSPKLLTCATCRLSNQPPSRMPGPPNGTGKTTPPHRSTPLGEGGRRAKAGTEWSATSEAAGGAGSDAPQTPPPPSGGPPPVG